MYSICNEYGCTEVTEGRWCEEHTTVDRSSRRRPRSFRAAGYDAAWDRLSRRARELQPWCSDCGTAESLTADHLPSAWARKAARLPLRLRDVDVVCGPCNSRRGSSRPGTPRAAGEPSSPAAAVLEGARRAAVERAARAAWESHGAPLAPPVDTPEV